MYGRFYILLICMVNLGKYTIKKNMWIEIVY